MEFFGGVEAAGIGEGGGEVVGGFGGVGGERKRGDGDDGVFNCGGEDSAVEVKEEVWGGGGGETSVQYLFSLSYKCLRAWRWRQHWPVHQLSCCNLGQCAESKWLCGRSGRRGIFQLIPVSGGKGGGGGVWGRSLS